MSQTLNAKISELRSLLKKCGKAAVALSGGVDSSFLAKMCRDALGDDALALTADTPFVTRSEISEAESIAREIGVKHEILKIEPTEDSILGNSPERCYHCKRLIFSRLWEQARAHGIERLLDGSNIDDLDDFRPGLKALKELKVESPLIEAGFAKKDIRRASAELGLPNWDRPSQACLASRIPVGRRIVGSDLKMVELAESYLMEKGIRQLRVRYHQDLARIEVSPEERAKFFDSGFMDEVFRHFKEIGFKHVALDLEGYRTGKMNL